MSRSITGKTCLFCDGPIISRGPARDAKVIYCSRACLRANEQRRNREAGRAPITKPCEECGKLFTYYASMRPNAAYCSQACKGRGNGRQLTGRIQNKFHRNSTFRKSMRRFFHDRCSICGWDEAPCDVAHIVSRKDGGDDALDNVTMLCPNHHRMFDLGLIPVSEIRAARGSVLNHQ